MEISVERVQGFQTVIEALRMKLLVLQVTHVKFTPKQKQEAADQAHRYIRILEDSFLQMTGYIEWNDDGTYTTLKPIPGPAPLGAGEDYW
jgi:hypothetical protein